MINVDYKVEQTFVPEIFQEELDVGPRKSVERGEAQRGIFCYARSTDL